MTDNNNNNNNGNWIHPNNNPARSGMSFSNNNIQLNSNNLIDDNMDDTEVANPSRNDGNNDNNNSENNRES